MEQSVDFLTRLARVGALWLALGATPSCERPNPAYRTAAGDASGADEAPAADAATGPANADAGAQPPPGTRSFADGFDDGVVGSAWATAVTGGCRVSEPSGQIRFALDGSTARCRALSREAFDLRHGQVRFAITPITNHAPPFRAFVTLAFADGAALSVAFANDTFVVEAPTSRPAATMPPAPYQPAPHHWRFVHDGRSLWFESSGDASTWRSVFDLGTDWPVDRVRVGMGAEARSTMPGPIMFNVGSCIVN